MAKQENFMRPLACAREGELELRHDGAKVEKNRSPKICTYVYVRRNVHEGDDTSQNASYAHYPEIATECNRRGVCCERGRTHERFGSFIHSSGAARTRAH